MTLIKGMNGIQEVDPDTMGATICGSCGRAWIEDLTPESVVCPWVFTHDDPEDWDDVPMYRLREWDDSTGEIHAEQMETHGMDELFVLSHPEGSAWIWATSRANAVAILDDILG